MVGSVPREMHDLHFNVSNLERFVVVEQTVERTAQFILRDTIALSEHLLDAADPLANANGGPKSLRLF